MRPPPRRVTVGPVRYKVRQDAEAVLAAQRSEGNEALLGHCDAQRLIIVVDDALAAGAQREILLHELLHALTLALAMQDELGEKAEELIVARLAPALLDLLRRNPKLVRWLCA
jgi:hypothetical protein